MAILINPHAGPPKPHRNGAISELRKTDISRHGVSGWTHAIRLRTKPHDPQTAAQLACRAPMRFARAVWHELTPDTWNLWKAYVQPNYFCEAVRRWCLLHAPAYTRVGMNDASTITIDDVTAVATSSGIMLNFTPSSPAALWGVAILRSENEITTPDAKKLIYIYPTSSAARGTYIDNPAKPATYHYRLAACEDNGRLGSFSTDVSATLP
jgi:hypothetical protein